MSILDKAIIRKTGYQKTESIEVPDFAECKVDKIPPLGLEAPYRRQDQYILELTLRVSFWANSVEYDTACENARTLMVRNLYEDCLILVHEIRSSILGGDKHEALKLLDKLIKLVTE